VENMHGKCLLLDKFTEVGLRQHLVQNDGVALIMNEEMEDTLRCIQVTISIMPPVCKFCFVSYAKEVKGRETFNLVNFHTIFNAW
jgi:lipoprotein signal peptidase